MDSIVIRPATMADAAAAIEIARKCWAPIYEGYGKILGEELYGTIAPNPLQDKADHVQTMIAENRTFVAECDGVICGFCGYVVNGEIGQIGSNAVLPECKGRGIAGMLYERVFEEFRLRGCTAALVKTGLDDGHAPARRAYQKMGFEVGLPSITYYKKL